MAQATAEHEGAHEEAQGGRGFVRALGLLLTCCAGVSGCIVTDPIDYDEDNIPANLTAVSPLTFTRVPPTADIACMGNTENGLKDNMLFEVQVLDANLSDELIGRVLVNGDLNPSNLVEPIAISGKMDRGVISLCVRRDLLDQPCNRVEYLVSRGFTDFPDYYTTRDRLDYAKVEWWVLGRAELHPTATANDCERLLRDGGVP
jgi:hypothetical protein